MRLLNNGALPIMKLAPLVVAALAATSGWYGAVAFMHQTGEPSANDGRKLLYYQSPMHPWVKSDKPGQCTVCGMDLVAIYEGGKNFDGEAAGIVMLPPGNPNVIGVQTSEVKRLPLARTLRVSGMIGEDESRHGVVSAPVEGRLDGLAMNHDGQQITRRQPLATIFSRPLLAAANDYKLSLAEGGPALNDAKRKLERYGLVWEQIKPIPDRQPDDIYFGVLATQTGTIVKSYVAEGQYVKEGERLFEIADFTKMWFHFAAYEQDLPFIKAGQIVNVEMPSLPGEIFKARVAAISPNLDEVTRSARVRVALENPERRIKNNTSATGVIEIEAPEVLAVARTAVLWPGAAPRVYVEKQAGVYEPRNVKLGRRGDTAWEVLDGLQEGERVVTSGNMLIDGQAQLNNLAAPAQQ